MYYDSQGREIEDLEGDNMREDARQANRKWPPTGYDMDYEEWKPGDIVVHEVELENGIPIEYTIITHLASGYVSYLDEEKCEGMTRETNLLRKTPPPKGLEVWQFEAIQSLINLKVNEVETGKRMYTSSQKYGDSRYHLTDKRSDGIQIEQINVDDKWGSRVFLYWDELPALLHTLLTWYLERRTPPGQSLPLPESSDLDEHPF